MEIPEAFAERPIRRWNTILTCGKVEEIFLKKNEQGTASGLKIIPLGGLEQIGLNITAFEYEDSIIVVDCGLSFPEDEMLGIDLVIPDVTYLKDNIDKVKGRPYRSSALYFEGNQCAGLCDKTDDGHY